MTLTNSGESIRNMKSTNLWTWLASLGGIGYFPKAPGTAGSIASLPLLWALSHGGIVAYGAILVVLIVASMGIAQKAGSLWQQTDDPRIVIDETVGLGIGCLALAPAEYLWFIAALLAFRVFDILKPWPASYFDKRCKNGFGTVMDDVMAGIYALGTVQLTKFLLTDWT